MSSLSGSGFPDDWGIQSMKVSDPDDDEDVALDTDGVQLEDISQEAATDGGASASGGF